MEAAAIFGKRQVNIKCTEQSFAEFPDLLYGTSTEDGITYFDATAYLNSRGVGEYYTTDGFLKNYFHPISALAGAYQLDKSRVCVQNRDGHLLLDSTFSYLFICYTNPDFLAHINDRIDELFTKGFCVSDTYLYHKSKERLSLEDPKESGDGHDDSETKG